MLTLNQIRSTFQTIAEAHRQINGFGFDNEANFGQSEDMQFPCLYVVQQPANISNGVISRTFDLFVLDRYYGDSDGDTSNITEVLSDTQLIAADIVSLLNNTEYEFQLDKNTVTLEPVYAEKDDLLAGYKATVTLTEGFDYWRCSVPYDFIVIEQVNGLQETSTNEKDPTVPAYVKAITEANIDAWNSAYPNANPSGFITSQALAGYYTTGNPSGFITSGQAALIYYPNSNPSGFLTGSQAANTYYPVGNPSGFLTTETDPTVPAVIKAMPTSGSAAPVGWNGSAYVLLNRSGTWAGRPTSPFVGQVYFATDLGAAGALLTWNGTRWTGRVTYYSGASAAAGNTTSLVVVASVNIPAGLLGTNSRIEVTGFAIATATQQFSFRAYMTPTSATDTTISFEFARALNLAANQRQVGFVKTITNLNSLSSQRYFMQIFNTSVYESSNTVDPATTVLSVNTANQFWINFAIQKGATGDSVALSHYLITIEL